MRNRGQGEYVSIYASAEGEEEWRVKARGRQASRPDERGLTRARTGPWERHGRESSVDKEEAEAEEREEEAEEERKQ